MDLRETGWGSVEWIQLAQDRGRWRAYVNTVMNLVLAPRHDVPETGICLRTQVKPALSIGPNIVGFLPDYRDRSQSPKRRVFIQIFLIKQSI
jgi:hypothetical protein